ncbi:MAG TPA: hypothetical protein VD713_06175, partial [Sphingomonadales bacterium]|nr:hypothetical protein [Sphingomonadales bacterium]
MQLWSRRRFRLPGLLGRLLAWIGSLGVVLQAGLATTKSAQARAFVTRGAEHWGRLVRLTPRS